MAKRKVIVKGGGSNLYLISESDNKIYIYKYDGGLFSPDVHIGTVSRMEDALAFIKNHSGRDIERIE